MSNILFSQEAESDYLESLRWYAARSKTAAINFEFFVNQAMIAIAADPFRYPKCDERHHYYLLKRFPFQIIYRILHNDECLVVAIAHTSREPGYWSER
ncbi:MAG: type II toxin-antitoxin system RelE/ParE family toxin [Pirellulales bacterium]|nr:type II toxin-antitoxin system RelE/ParE family toxin [Pirellulales bacterium]